MSSNLLGQLQMTSEGISKSTSTFKYQPLQQPTVIRIIVLQHGSRNDPIECRLLDTELGKQHYEALSYEWGLPSNNDPTIVLDGCDVRIRTNLLDALAQIRLEEEDRYIWIDALCIDQANVRERNQQVQLMGKIYGGARNVIIWLGQAKDNSDFAIEMAERTNELTREKIIQHHAAFLELCQRPYWRRVWVTQEIHLAKSYMIHCGSKSISGKVFDILMDPTNTSIFGPRFSDIYGYRDRIHLSAAGHHMMPRRMHPYHNTLIQWLRLSIYSDLVCVEPRDVIYAMLGIASDCQNGEILPDYRKPLLEVYLEAITLCKQDSQSGLSFALRLAGRLGLNVDEIILRLIFGIDNRDYMYDGLMRFVKKCAVAVQKSPGASFTSA